jgi:glutamate synthase domain-containing protein 2/glutamate synthase domain-containing protein 1/glutamate synthase domain-containing protein 3
VYEVKKGNKTILEADACGIGFLASRKGLAERKLVQYALDLACKYDHRGAPGHGAGLQLDIPWPIILERFPEHAKLIAQRDLALGMFFLPFDAGMRRRCVAIIEELAQVAGADVLGWADVPVDSSALPKDSEALRTLPRVRQAIFQRPAGMNESDWFACRYLLRLAIDEKVGPLAGDLFAVASLSNRTVVYKGLVELSKISQFYPDLRNEDYASRYALFHSRYSTNTTTAWRRAQPFWAIAHNGEIATINGNVDWMTAIGQDLIKKLSDNHPMLGRLAEQVDTIVSPHGSDTANLDDMLLALVAGGMKLSEAILALLPEAASVIQEDDPLHSFYRSMQVYLGACDGPAAIVACDGSQAVAHLDRNGLRPLWVEVTDDYVFAASELTGTRDIGKPNQQKLLGPGGTVSVDLRTGAVDFDEAAHQKIAESDFPRAEQRIRKGESAPPNEAPENLVALQRSFGMSEEDLSVSLATMRTDSKPAVGSMGDDTPPAAMLDEFPRRIEDHFKLRFAQETSPPIDPIRDRWVFNSFVVLGDRSGLWSESEGQLYEFDSRILSRGEIAWLKQQDSVRTFDLTFDAAKGEEAIEKALDDLVNQIVSAVEGQSVILISDANTSAEKAPLPSLRAVSRLHDELSRRGVRQKTAIMGEFGVWDIHQCALHIAMGCDALCPWIGCLSVKEEEDSYLRGLNSGFIEVMSMMGVTPSSAYCGARLAEAVGLDAKFLKKEFPKVPGHLGGIGPEILNQEWFSFHRDAYCPDFEDKLPDLGEFRHAKNGRPHANDAQIVRHIHAASGYAKKSPNGEPGSYESYQAYSDIVNGRKPITLLDCLQIQANEPVPVEEVEPVENILWRFMAPGMSEGALSEPAHRAIARSMNVLYRYCKIRAARTGRPLPAGIGPIANSGEGGFDKARVGTRDQNRSVQYAGGRFTITPLTAANADEAEIKFAQGAKPGKGGQLPGKKVSEMVAQRRGCNPGYELVSPPINHNLYSIEDVKLMLESWRHLRPDVSASLKFVATYGVELVCLGGVNAGANRLHISDGSGGTGAAKRVDQKHAGAPSPAVLPVVQDRLVEENVRHLVEISVDGGVQNGEQALKLMLLGADRVGFGTNLLMSIGCSMLRKCHLAGPLPTDPTGKRRLGCAPGVATQDPALVAKFAGKSRHISRVLYHTANEMRERMAKLGIRSLGSVVGRRDLLNRRSDLTGKAALLDLRSLTSAPSSVVQERDIDLQSEIHLPPRRADELDAAEAALAGSEATVKAKLTNESRCVGMQAAGIIARERGDAGLDTPLKFQHTGAAGHFYGAYSTEGMEFHLEGLAADSAWTAAYGGKLVVVSPNGDTTLTVVGNTFGYGARGGKVFLAGRGGNRFGICLRQSHERTAAQVVVEGVEANAFQYMTGGTALVLGPIGLNLGSGMTGGTVYLLDPDEKRLNQEYVQSLPLEGEDAETVQRLLQEHLQETGSANARELLESFDPGAFRKVVTCREPENYNL